MGVCGWMCVGGGCGGWVCVGVCVGGVCMCVCVCVCVHACMFNQQWLALVSYFLLVHDKNNVKKNNRSK